MKKMAWQTNEDPDGLKTAEEDTSVTRRDILKELQTQSEASTMGTWTNSESMEDSTLSRSTELKSNWSYGSYLGTEMAAESQVSQLAATEVRKSNKKTGPLLLVLGATLVAALLLGLAIPRIYMHRMAGKGEGKKSRPQGSREPLERVREDASRHGIWKKAYEDDTISKEEELLNAAVIGLEQMWERCSQTVKEAFAKNYLPPAGD